MATMPKFPLRLVRGYRDFLVGRMPTERDRYRELARRGQSPDTMIIGCCDSRVSPEVIFDAHPGELFVVRNIANLVPPFTSDGVCHGVFAALEFAVQVLGVGHIIVLGHAHCGGIRAYAEHGPPLSPADSIHKWMSLIAPAADLAGTPDGRDDYLTRLEQASIAKSSREPADVSVCRVRGATRRPAVARRLFRRVDRPGVRARCRRLQRDRLGSR